MSGKTLARTVAGGALVAAGVALIALGIRIELGSKKKSKKVVITGGSGNLGTKLAAHLCAVGGYEVVLVEHPDFYIAERKPAAARVVLGDCGVYGGWVECMRGAYAVVHFSAVNPYPNASWRESAESMDHCFNVLAAAANMKARRLVLASSNHVMGGYKDRRDHNVIKPTDDPLVGTMLLDEAARAKSGDAVAYAAAKLAAERLAKTLHASTTTEYLTLRIGWCQPGPNLPSTLSAAGVPPEFQTPTAGGIGDDDVDEKWFTNMWLSNRDFINYFDAALHAPIDATAHVVVNAMSNNAESRWCLKATENILGVTSMDDACRRPTSA